jgi:hypothetical protein
LTELVIILLFLSLLMFIAYPFFRPPEVSSPSIKLQTRLDELLNDKEEAYLSLKDIELDYRMGKLSKHDYAMLREESENRAVAILKEIEATQASLGRSSKKSQKKS